MLCGLKWHSVLLSKWSREFQCEINPVCPSLTVMCSSQRQLNCGKHIGSAKAVSGPVRRVASRWCMRLHLAFSEQSVLKHLILTVDQVFLILKSLFKGQHTVTVLRFVHVTFERKDSLKMDIFRSSASCRHSDALS